MTAGIFRKLSPSNAEALHRPDPIASISADINIDELSTALRSVRGELEVTQASLQKLYEEASYVYTRLDHMEQSLVKSKGDAIPQKTAAEKKLEEEDGGEQGATGTGGVVVEKKLFIGTGDEKFDEKLAKIQEAKGLTKGLLENIESLALKAQNVNTLESTSPGMRR